MKTGRERKYNRRLRVISYYNANIESLLEVESDSRHYNKVFLELQNIKKRRNFLIRWLTDSHNPTPQCDRGERKRLAVMSSS